MSINLNINISIIEIIIMNACILFTYFIVILIKRDFFQSYLALKYYFVNSILKIIIISCIDIKNKNNFTQKIASFIQIIHLSKVK
jgi:hypothetical protein